MFSYTRKEDMNTNKHYFQWVITLFALTLVGPFVTAWAE